MFEDLKAGLLYYHFSSERRLKTVFFILFGAAVWFGLIFIRLNDYFGLEYTLAARSGLFPIIVVPIAMIFGLMHKAIEQRRMYRELKKSAAADEKGE